MSENHISLSFEEKSLKQYYFDECFVGERKYGGVFTKFFIKYLLRYLGICKYAEVDSGRGVKFLFDVSNINEEVNIQSELNVKKMLK